MTKVRVCVGVNKQGAYYSYGNITVPDKDAEVIVRGSLRNDPEVSVSFHDLEVMTPQAPVVEALSSEGHTFEYGDLIEGTSKHMHLKCGSKYDGHCVVTHSRPSKCEGDNCIAFCNPEDFSKVKEPLDYRGLNAAGIHGNGWQPRYLKVAAKVGDWHIANGKVVLSPPPQPEPEVKPVEWVPEFGDLIVASGNKYSVITSTDMNNWPHAEADYIDADRFHVIKSPTTYEAMKHMSLPRGTYNGWGIHNLILKAKAGQWHINSSGEVVLKPKPEVPKPKFKRGDKVTRMQLGKVETWQVVESTPDADGMIVLLSSAFPLYPDDTWGVLVTAYGEGACGRSYRMSYEDDCTLVPEVTAPQGLKPGDMVVDQNNELWDVDEVSTDYPGFVWLSSKNLVGRRLGSAHNLKKVVFGTL